MSLIKMLVNQVTYMIFTQAKVTLDDEAL